MNNILLLQKTHHPSIEYVITYNSTSILQLSKWEENAAVKKSLMASQDEEQNDA